MFETSQLRRPCRPADRDHHPRKLRYAESLAAARGDNHRRQNLKAFSQAEMDARRAGRQNGEKLPEQVFAVLENHFCQIEPFTVKNIEDKVAEPLQATGFQIGLQIIEARYRSVTASPPPT